MEKFLARMRDWEGMIIAAVPVMLIPWALLYEYGYLDFYGLPKDIVEIGILQLFRSAALPIILLTMVVAGWPILVLWVVSLARRKGISEKAILLLGSGIFPLPMVLGLIYSLGPFLSNFTYILSAIILMAPPFLLIFGNYDRKHSGGAEASDSLGRDFMQVLIMLAIFSLPFSYAVGYGEAKRNEMLSLREGDPSYVLVRRYGDNLVFMEFNKESKKVGPKFELSSIGSDKLTFSGWVNVKRD